MSIKADMIEQAQAMIEWCSEVIEQGRDAYVIAVEITGPYLAEGSNMSAFSLRLCSKYPSKAIAENRCKGISDGRGVPMQAFKFTDAAQAMIEQQRWFIEQIQNMDDL